MEPLRFDPDDIAVTGIQIFRSTDGGASWTKPQSLIQGREVDGNDDKGWLVCDRSPSSPYKGHVYVAWGVNGPRNIQMFLTCGPHNNLNLGPASVRYGFLNEYNSYEFSLPVEVVQTFQENHSGCRLSVAHSMGNPGGAQFRMDNMGFIQP